MLPVNSDLYMSFPATVRGLHAALETVERHCADRSVDPDLVSRLRIIVEELFTNTIKHGYGAECDRPVRLGLTTDPVLRLTFEDDAAHFDPTAWKPGHHGELPPNLRPEGQAGIAMIMGLSSEVRHVAGPAGNRVAITIALQKRS